MDSDQLKTLLERLENYSNSLERRLAAGTLLGFMEHNLGLQWLHQIPWWTFHHIQEWSRLVQTEQKLLIEAARDHGKSTFFSFVYPLWSVQQVKHQAEGFGVALFSYAETQAQENIKRIRQTIEGSPQLQWLLPTLKSSVWDSANLDLSNGCWIKSYGFGSAYRGRHPKITIIDDPCKDHGTMSIEQQIQFFAGVIIPAAKHGSQIVVTGNPVDKVDFLQWLEGNKAFHHHYYPVMNERGEPLCPGHYSVEAIEDKRQTIPTHIFAREYLLKRVSADNAKFQEEWIRYYEDQEIQDRLLHKILTIDPAISPGGDKLGVVLTGTDSDHRTYVLERMGFQGSFKDGIGQLCEMIERNLPIDRIGIETFAFQKMYEVWLSEELKSRGLSVGIEELGKDTKRTKAMRIESLQPKLQQGRLFFKKDQRPIVDQLLLWDPISKTNDDDEIDALAWQVPLWQSPLDTEPPPDYRAKPGTFAEALASIRSSNDGYIDKLFADLH